MDKNYVWQVGEYIAEGHKISEAVERFNKSTSSIKKYLAKIRDRNSEFYNKILAEKISLAQAKIGLEASIKGGSNGKRGRNLNDEQAAMYLEAFMGSGLSLEGFAELSYIPKSTLYDTFCAFKDKNPELYERFREYMTRYIPTGDLDKGFDIEDSSWKR